ncbi:hypothetical protein [Priestia endophytica]|uniref:hypothetical protein n=1 Tax=Priestia endophytica TaxID=135735 RepID=UPI000DCA963C|nr:hypothetical protein [Priestia endophytica]RAS75714.1 hypothetical protein A4R27_21945 [Priestia endophytica]
MQLKGAVEQRKKRLIQQLIFEKGYIKEEYSGQLCEITLSELEALYVKYAKEIGKISFIHSGKKEIKSEENS